MDEIVIYYFSGTGNSLFVAKELQKRISDSSLIPIISLLDERVIHTKGKTIALVFPVHAITIPIAVKKFLMKADFESSEYLFAIVTREGTIFKGFQKIDRILNKKNKQLDAGFILNMYNNDTRHENYKVPSESDISALESVVLKKLDFIQNIIKYRMASREKDSEYTIDFGHNPFVNKILEKIVLTGMTVSEYIGGVNYFYSDSNCIGCGICEKVCLSKKISMIDKKPIWNKKVLCYMCFACLNYCPKRSVQISDIPGVKSYTKINGRYTHPYAAINDICKQKQES